MSASAAPVTAIRPPHAAHNFWMLVGDVGCFFIGISFLDSATALPVVVTSLGGSPAFLGILLALKQAGVFLPQLLVAHQLHGAKRFLPYLLKVAFAGRIGWLFAALALYYYGASNPALALSLFAVTFVLLWICDGAGVISWMTIVGRAIPARERGKMFAWTQIVSAFSRFGVSAIVAALLAQKGAKFPANIALLTFFCFVFLMISWGFLVALREPPAPALTDAADEITEEPAPSLGEYLRRLPEKFRERPDFALLAVVQILATAAGASMPFLVGYAKGVSLPAHLPSWLSFLQSGGLPGLFLACQTLGLLLFAPVWGIFSDRFGPRTALRGVMLMGLLCPLLALAGGHFRSGSGGLLCFLLAYFAFGAAQDGWIMVTNYLLEAIPERQQSGFIGLMNAASAPSLILPFAAGFTVKGIGAEIMFSGAALLLFAGFFCASRLPETRKKRV